MAAVVGALALVVVLHPAMWNQHPEISKEMPPRPRRKLPRLLRSPQPRRRQRRHTLKMPGLRGKCRHENPPGNRQR